MSGVIDLAASTHVDDAQQLTVPVCASGSAPRNPSPMVKVPAARAQPDIAALFNFYWYSCLNRRAKCRSLSPGALPWGEAGLNLGEIYALRLIRCDVFPYSLRIFKTQVVLRLLKPRGTPVEQDRS